MNDSDADRKLGHAEDFANAVVVELAARMGTAWTLTRAPSHKKYSLGRLDSTWRSSMRSAVLADALFSNRSDFSLK